MTLSVTVEEEEEEEEEVVLVEVEKVGSSVAIGYTSFCETTRVSY